MSDNIDYAELDKAVNEAIQSRSAAKPRVSSKPVAKPVMQRPHGQFMDFAPVRPHKVGHPAPVSAKPITRPVARTVSRPMSSAAMHPAVQRPMRPTHAQQPIAPRPAASASKITTAPQPAIVPRSEKIGSAVKTVRPSVSAQIQHKQQVVAAKPAPKAEPKPVVKPATKPITKPAEKPAAKPVEKPTPKTEKSEKKSAPNANNYSLGVRSPFMTNTKVEKRPLGKDIPETSVTNLHSTKNIYSSKSPSKATKAVKKKHMVTEAPKKHSGWLWTLVVLLVIGAGAGLGYLAYILVFAK